MQLTFTDEQQQQIAKVKAMVDRKKYVDKNDIMALFKCNEKRAKEIMQQIQRDTDHLVIRKKGTSNVLTTKEMTTKEKLDYIIDNVIIPNLTVPNPTDLSDREIDKYELELTEQIYYTILSFINLAKIGHHDDEVGLNTLYCVGNKYDVWISFICNRTYKKISLRRFIVFKIDDDEEIKKDRLKLYNHTSQIDILPSEFLNRLGLDYLEIRLIENIDYEYSIIFG